MTKQEEKINVKYRVSVYRSNRAIYAQFVDDLSGKTLVSGSTLKSTETGTPTEKATGLGKILAKDALSKKITKVVFDRNGNRYHGQIKALAEGLREGGLEF